MISRISVLLSSGIPKCQASACGCQALAYICLEYLLRTLTSSTATHNMQLLAWTFLFLIPYLVVLAIFAFKTWIAEQVLATLEALSHLCGYIARLFHKQPFRFLDLPPEIRNMVYDHHFTLYRTRWYQQRARQVAMLPDAILGVNRQVYEEASHVLYSDSCFGFKIGGKASVHRDEKQFAGVLRRVPHVFEHIQAIDLEIYWFRSGWPRWSE